MQIDIATRFIPDDQRVFVLHPGDRKKFYGAFLDQDAVFLDLPGADFRELVDIDKQRIRAQILKSRQIATWHRQGADKKNEPSRNINDYLDKAERRSKARYWTEIKGLYSDAKPGDVIIAPGAGYTSLVLIGEFVGHFRPGTVATSRIYGNEKIPARNVKWLQPHQQKREFSERLIKLMQNRQALIEIHAADEKREVYDLIYRDYAWGQTAVGHTIVASEKIDLRNFGDGSNIIYYFAAMYAAIDKDNLADFVKLGFAEAIRKYYEPDTFTDTGISVHSPGDIWLHTKRITLPAFLGIMLALTDAHVPVEAAQQVVITNSSAANVKDTCPLDLPVRVQQSTHAMGAALWEKICHERQKEQKLLNLQSPMPMKGIPDPAKKAKRP